MQTEFGNFKVEIHARINMQQEGHLYFWYNWFKIQVQEFKMEAIA